MEASVEEKPKGDLVASEVQAEEASNHGKDLEVKASKESSNGKEDDGTILRNASSTRDVQAQTNVGDDELLKDGIGDTSASLERESEAEAMDMDIYSEKKRETQEMDVDESEDKTLHLTTKPPPDKQAELDSSTAGEASKSAFQDEGGQGVVAMESHESQPTKEKETKGERKDEKLNTQEKETANPNSIEIHQADDSKQSQTTEPVPSHTFSQEPEVRLSKIFHFHCEGVKENLRCVVSDSRDFQKVLSMKWMGENCYSSETMDVHPDWSLHYFFLHSVTSGWFNRKTEDILLARTVVTERVHQFLCLSDEGFFCLLNSVVLRNVREKPKEDFLEEMEALIRDVGFSQDNSWLVGQFEQFVEKIFRGLPVDIAVILTTFCRPRWVLSVAHDNFIQGVLSVSSQPIFKRYNKKVFENAEAFVASVNRSTFSWITLLCDPQILSNQFVTTLFRYRHNSVTGDKGWVTSLNKLHARLTERSDIQLIVRVLFELCQTTPGAFRELFAFCSKLSDLEPQDQLRELAARRFEELMTLTDSLSYLKSISSEFPSEKVPLCFQRSFSSCFVTAVAKATFAGGPDVAYFSTFILKDPRFHTVELLSVLLPKIVSSPGASEILSIALRTGVQQKVIEDSFSEFLRQLIPVTEPLSSVLNKFAGLLEFDALQTPYLEKLATRYIEQVLQKMPSKVVVAFYPKLTSLSNRVVQMYLSALHSHHLKEFQGSLKRVERGLALLSDNNGGEKLDSVIDFTEKDERFIALLIELVDTLPEGELSLERIVDSPAFWIHLVSRSPEKIRGSKVVKRVLQRIQAHCESVKRKTILVEEVIRKETILSNLSKLTSEPISALDVETVVLLIEKTSSQLQELHQFFIFCQEAGVPDVLPFIESRNQKAANLRRQKILLIASENSYWGELAPFLELGAIMKKVGETTSFRKIFSRECQKLSALAMQHVLEKAGPESVKLHKERVITLFTEQSTSLADCDDLFSEMKPEDVEADFEKFLVIYHVDHKKSAFIKELVKSYSCGEEMRHRGELLDRFLKNLDVSDISSLKNILDQAKIGLERKKLSLVSFHTLYRDFEDQTSLSDLGWQVVSELATGSELLKFLTSNLNEDFRVLIDAVEEHSDQLIREDTVSDLISTKRALMCLLQLPSAERKIEKVLPLVRKLSSETLSESFYLRVKNCNTNVHALARLYNNLANRGEVTKEIVENSLRAGTFHFEIDKSHLNIELRYNVGKGDSRYSLSHLADLRSRALLIANTEKPSVGVLVEVEKADMKPKMTRFIAMIDKVQEIASACEEIESQGVYYAEMFPMELREGNLEATLNNLTERAQVWFDSLMKARNQHFYLNYFTPFQFWELYDFLILSQNLRQKQPEKLLSCLNLLAQCDREVSAKDVLELAPLQTFSSSSLTEKLDALGKGLTNLLSSKAFLKRPFPTAALGSLQDAVDARKLSIAVTEDDRFVGQVIFSYYSHSHSLPLPSQILFCSGETEWEQLHLLLLRCFLPGGVPGIYCVVGVEKLEFRVQALLVNSIRQYSAASQVDWRLLLIVPRLETQQSLLDQFSDCHHVAYGLSNDSCSEIIKAVCQNSLCFISQISGLGKTEQARQAASLRNKVVRTLPVAGAVGDEHIVDRLLDLQLKSFETLHLDIGPVTDVWWLNSVLFQLLVVGSIRCNAKAFRYLQGGAIPVTYVEIANSLNNRLADSLQFTSFMHRVDLRWDLAQLLVSRDPMSHYQVACNYFLALERGSLGTQDLIFQPPNQNCFALSSSECQRLLQVYFFDHYKEKKLLVEGMNFNLLNAFVRVFSEQLWSFSESAFFKIANLKDMTKEAEAIRVILFNNLREVAAEFATRSVTLARGSQRKNLLEEAVSAMESMTNWYEKKHLVVAFQSQTRQTISALYRDKDLVPKELRTLLRTQSNASNWTLDDLTALKPDELLIRLERLARTSTAPLNHSPYSLTSDNLLKISLILLRVRASVPVIIMGETGCGKTSLIKFLANVVQVKFRCLNLHAGVHEQDIVHFVESVEALAMEHGAVWAFFDEINACDQLGVLKEVICDRRIRGRNIHPAISMIAACNPYRRATLSNDVKPSSALVKETPNRTNSLAPKLVYRVHPLPEAMLDFVWDYGALTKSEEGDYVGKMVEELQLPGQLPKTVSDCLCYSQDFIRNIEGNYSVSLRDVKRCIDLIRWFKLNPAPQLSAKKASGLGAMTPDRRAIILGLAHCYHSRLTTSAQREDYREIMAKCFGKDFVSKTFDEILRSEQKSYLSMMDLPEGTAMNSALLENVFVLLVCILNKIPVFLVGKPGCSKSLSMQLIRATLRGPDSKHPFFQKLPQLYIVSYQGSDSSTSEGILSIFEKASNYQEKNPEKVISVVLLDEIGLAEISPNNPLKVLHSLLEPEFPNTRPRVAVVGISNWALDAAKMNRAIHLSRPEPTEVDLIETGISIYSGTSSSPNRVRLECIAQAFHQYSSSQQFPNFHGLRDYYSLVKAISRSPPALEVEDLIEMVDRDFGGLPTMSKNVRRIFLEKLSSFFTPKVSPPNYLRLIQENIQDHHARHLMVISKGDVGLSIIETTLRQQQITPVIIFGSKFPNDQSEEYSYRILSRIILCMEAGEVVILRDLNVIYGSLYDMLNQNYTLVGAKKNCRIALGANSNPMCHVHQNFRCVVLMEEEHVLAADPPFLNRFEKQYLAYDHLLQEPRSVSLCERLKEWVTEISRIDLHEEVSSKSRFSPVDMFPVFTEHSVSSLILKYSSETDERDVLESCKKDLILTCPSDAIIRSQKSRLSIADNQEVTKWKEFYFDTIGKLSFPQLIRGETSFPMTQLLILTLSSIHENLQGILSNFKVKATVAKLGSFSSEKHLSSELIHFWEKSKADVFVLQFDPILNREHISMVKFTLDRLKDSYPQSPKRIVMVAHLRRAITMTTQNTEWQFDFMSGWRQIMVDSLNPEEGIHSSLMKESLEEILRDEQFPFAALLEQILLWCFSCIKYPSTKDAITRIHFLKGNIMRRQDFIAFLRVTVLQVLSEKHEDDWQVKIACDSQRLFISATFASALRQYVRERVREPVAKVIFLLEKSSALESYFLYSDPEPLFKTWKQCFSEIILPEAPKIVSPKGVECYILEEDSCLPLALPFSREKFRKFESHRPSLLTALKLAQEEDDFELEAFLNLQREVAVSLFAHDLPNLNSDFEGYLRDFFLLQKIDASLPLPLRRWILANQCVLSSISSPFDLHLTWWIRKSQIESQFRLLCALRDSPNFSSLHQQTVGSEAELGQVIFEFLAEPLYLKPASVANMTALASWQCKLNQVLSLVKVAGCLDSPLVHLLRILNDFATMVVLSVPSTESQKVSLVLTSFLKISQACRSKDFIITSSIFSVVIQTTTTLSKSIPDLTEACERFLGSFLRRSLDQVAADAQLIAEILNLLKSKDFTLASKASSLFLKLANSLDVFSLLALLKSKDVVDSDLILEVVHQWLVSLGSLDHHLAVLLCDYIEDVTFSGVLQGDELEDAIQVLLTDYSVSLRVVTAVAVIRAYLYAYLHSANEAELLSRIGTRLTGNSPRAHALKVYILKNIRQHSMVSLSQLRNAIKPYPWLRDLPWSPEKKRDLPYDPFSFDLGIRKHADSVLSNFISGVDNRKDLSDLLTRKSEGEKKALLGSVFAHLFGPRAFGQLELNEVRACNSLGKIVTELPISPSALYPRVLLFFLTNDMNGYPHLQLDPSNPSDFHLTGVLSHFLGVLASGPSSREKNCPFIQTLRNPKDIPSSFLVAQPSNERASIFRALQLSSEKTQVTRYLCSNGHMYVIADCGKPVSSAVCPECKQQIGGNNYAVFGNSKRLDDVPDSFVETDSPGYVFESLTSTRLPKHTVRSLPTLAFRVLHFLYHSSLVLSWISAPRGDDSAAVALQNLGTEPSSLDFFMAHVRQDWIVLQELFNLPEEEVAMVLHEILHLYFSVAAFPSEPWRSADTRNAWEDSFLDVCLRPLLSNPSQFLNSFKSRSQEISQEQRKLENEIEELNVHEARQPEFSQKSLPSLLRIREAKSLENFRARFAAVLKHAASFPFLQFYLNSFDDLHQVSKIKSLVQWVRLVRDQLSYKLKRIDALKVTVSQVIESSKDPQQYRDAYFAFEKAWNSLRGSVTAFECKELPYPIPEMNQDLPIIFSLVEEENEGAFLCSLLNSLATLQNVFIHTSLAISAGGCTSLKFLQQSEAEGAIAQVKLFSAKDSQLLEDVWSEQLLYLGFNSPEYGQGRNVLYDFGRIESELAAGSLLNKASLVVGGYPPFPFHLEIFHKCYEILDNIKGHIPQAPLLQEVLLNFKSMPTVKEKASELLAVLNVIICFIKKSGGGQDQTIEEYCTTWLPEDGSCKPLLATPISKLPLKNLVSVYEMIEEIMSDRTATEFTHEKFCASVPNDLEAELLEFVKDLNLSRLLTCLKRFVFRFLGVEKLNPQHPLKDWLFTVNCWPGDEKEADEIQRAFPPRLTLSQATQTCKILLLEEERRAIRSAPKVDKSRAFLSSTPPRQAALKASSFKKNQLDLAS